MGITRSALPFESDFVRVPNAWVRDTRLSRRARGILSEIMSHSIGWHVTIASLQKNGPEGRDAIRNAVDELKEYGYVRLKQGRDPDGRWNEIEYELCEPPAAGTVVGKPDSGGFTDSGSTDSGSTDSGKPDTKKTSTSENHQQEDHQQEILPAGENHFTEFYAIWPRKVDRPAAEKAWGQAMKRADANEVISAAIAYRDNPARPQKQYIPYPATWLNRDGWNDELPEATKDNARPSADDKFLHTLEMGRRLQERANLSNITSLTARKEIS